MKYKFLFFILLLLSCGNNKSITGENQFNTTLIYDQVTAYMQIDDPYLYIVTQNGDLLRKNIRQSNTTFEKLTAKDEMGNSLFVLAVDAYGQEVIVSAKSGVWHSRDGGQSWNSTSLKVPPFKYPMAIRRAPDKPNIILGKFGGALMRSTDFGDHWKVILGDSTSNGGLEATIKWDPHHLGDAWIFGNGNFEISSLIGLKDYGNNIIVAGLAGSVLLGQPHDPPLPVVDISFEKNSTRNVYVLSDQLYKSIDEGITWKKMSKNVSPDEWFSTMTEDTRLPHSFFFLTNKTNLYHTRDGFVTKNFIRKLDNIGEFGSGSLVLDAQGQLLFINGSNGIFST